MWKIYESPKKLFLMVIITYGLQHKGRLLLLSFVGSMPAFGAVLPVGVAAVQGTKHAINIVDFFVERAQIFFTSVAVGTLKYSSL